MNDNVVSHYRPTTVIGSSRSPSGLALLVGRALTRGDLVERARRFAATRFSEYEASQLQTAKENRGIVVPCESHDLR